MIEQAHRELNTRIYELFSRISKALAHSRRLELLDLLAQGEYSVEELARASHMSTANTSQHLQTLRSAGLVTNQRNKNKIIYRLADPEVYRVSQAIYNLGKLRIPEADRLFGGIMEKRKNSGEVSIRHLLESLDNGNTTLLDVRSEGEYLAGHIPGAVSIPASQIKRRIGEIPVDREIIVYCRGNYCVFSDSAIVTLKKYGFKARRLENGFAEWRVLGYPVNKGFQKDTNNQIC